MEEEVESLLLAVLDDVAALKAALLAYGLDAVIQRCLVQKERKSKNILSKRYWGEVAQFFNRLRKAHGLLAWARVF
ncbi:MAG: hypothetical protein LBU79_06930 [Planctomycetota bacterium]|jgi:transposase-like protein|nr:hypothetical protein [Planctomycetota bacterium]